jgi:hypothetical protein
MEILTFHEDSGDVERVFGGNPRHSRNKKSFSHALFPKALLWEIIPSAGARGTQRRLSGTKLPMADV